MKTKPMRMRWSFVISMAARDLEMYPPEMTAQTLRGWAALETDLFPDGMDLADAQWILANPDAFTDGEP